MSIFRRKRKSAFAVKYSDTRRYMANRPSIYDGKGNRNYRHGMVIVKGHGIPKDLYGFAEEDFYVDENTRKLYVFRNSSLVFAGTFNATYPNLRYLDNLDELD